MKKFIITIMVMFTIIVGMGLGNEAFGLEDVDIMDVYDNLEEVFEYKINHYYETDIKEWSRYGLYKQTLTWNPDTLRFVWTIVAYDRMTDSFVTEVDVMEPIVMEFVYYQILNA